ncbi:MAG: hypothetical protein R3B13_20700 [Polyangiaceae bacterium]
MMSSLLSTSRRLTIAATLLCAAAFACSSRATHEGSGSGGSGGQSGGGGSGAQSGAAGAGAQDAGTDGPPPTQSGIVELYQYDAVSGNSSQLALQARFGPEVPPDCTRVTNGNCTLDVCTDTVPTGTIVGAGDITFRNATTGQALSALPFQADTGYVLAPQTVSPPFASSGDEIEISAPGDVVPAFKATQKMPASVALTTSTSQAASVDRTKPYQITWANGGADPVVVQIFGLASAPAQASVSLRCEFPAASQAASVPTDMLQALAKNGKATIYITARTTRRSTPVTTRCRLGFTAR